MPDELEITDIQISPPWVDTIPEPERDEHSSWIDIVVSVSNRTDDNLYVNASLRSLTYDQIARTLNLNLYEREPPTEYRPLRFREPNQITLEPHQSSAIKITVPLVMRQIIPGDDKIRFEQIDLANLEQVAIAISYDRTPFFPTATKSVPDQMRDLNAWGKMTRKLVKTQIPQADKVNETKPD
jgi:hypothetical protein